MSDGTQSPVLGDQEVLDLIKSKPQGYYTTTHEIPANTKIAKIGTTFCKALIKIELTDSDGYLTVSEGIERSGGSNWQEALIPENETLIGF